MAYGDAGGRDCTYEELTTNIADLPFVYMLSDYPTINSGLSKNDDEQYAIGSSMVSREFNESRHSFLRQSFEASIRMYRPHNKYLEREFGFTIEQAVRCLGYIEDILTKCRQSILRSKPINISSILTNRTTTEDYFSQINSTNKVVFVTDSDKYARESRLIEEYYQYISDKRALLSLTQPVLLKRLPEDLPQSVLTRFLERMSIDIDDVDEGTPSGDKFRYPYQINPLHKHPLPQVDQRVFLPYSDAVRRSFRETFYYDLISLPDYGDPSGNSGGAFGDTFGDYLEDWSYECMLEIFGEDQVFKNPLYPNKNFNEACDILVKYDDILYVIECKIGKLPQQTRTGEIEAIRQSLEAKVMEAYEDQAMKFIDKVRNEEIDSVVYNGEPVDISGYSKFQPIVVTDEPYDDLATIHIDRIFNTDDVLPYLIEIIDLQALTTYLSDKTKLSEYIDSRTKIFRERRYKSPNEMDFLGYYVENGCEFPDVDEADEISLDGFHNAVISEIRDELGGPGSMASDGYFDL